MKNRALPVLLVLAGLAWTSAQALLPDMGLEWADRLTAVADARGRQSAASALLMLAGSFLVLAAIAMALASRTGPGARLTRIGTVLLGLGGIWLVAGRGVFSMTMLRLTGPEVDSDAALAALSGEGGPEYIALLPTLPALLLDPVLLAIGTRRARMSSWLPLVCWVVGIGTFVATEFTIKLGESLGIAVASIGLVLIGLALSRATPDAPSATAPVSGPQPARASTATRRSATRP